MSGLLYNEVVKRTISLLQTHRHNNKNDDWENRYKGYLDKIKLNVNKRIKITTLVKKPLFIYTTISNETKANPVWYLRFMGQNVGKLYQKDNDIVLQISKKDFKNNYDTFKDEVFNVNPGDYKWDKDQAAEDFRAFFYNYVGAKHNDNYEHTVESAFLTDLEKKKGQGKNLKNIQPIEINGKRFQMPTPLKASNLHKVMDENGLAEEKYYKYAAQYGGGIDVLARRRSGHCSYVTVIELKDKNDKNEPPEKVMYQAIAYATFIHELLRSEKADGQGWYNLFLEKTGRKLPDKLVIKCVVAMPGLDVDSLDKKLKGKNLNVLKPFVNYPEDELRLHFIELDDKSYTVKDYSKKL